MFKQYEKTSLETWLEELYISKGIITPDDLRIENVANLFGISIVYMEKSPERAIWDEEDAVIFLKPNQYEEIKREKFYHELCHPLRHYGDQTNMKVRTFQELQEIQANQFQLYAAIPFYMFDHLEPMVYEEDMINQIQSVFKVSKNLVKRRYEQIKRRVFQAISDAEHRAYMNSLYPKAPPYTEETNTVLDQLQMILKKRGVKA